ncbi:MAG: hypothetical protein JXR78_10250 [Victivallales bacterium]|nr:hypothetical protein [Victivallales bacterium]
MKNLRRIKRLVDAYKMVDGKEKPDIGFCPGFLAQSSLPYREPDKNLPLWSRRNGIISLSIYPGLFQHDDSIEYIGFPYGVLPRLIILYLASQAKINQSPEVELGDNITDFLRRLGKKNCDTRLIARMRDQARRLFTCHFQFTGRCEGMEFGNNTPLITNYRLWIGSGKHDATPDLFRAKIKINDLFYQEFNESFPINLDQLKGLAKSPLAIDLYMWLVRRVYKLEKPVNVSWENLFNQFGQQMKSVKRFSQNIRKELGAIKIVWPTLNVDIYRGGLTIRPSQTPIPEKLDF